MEHRDPRACASTFWRIPPTRKKWSGSSRTTMNPEPLPLFLLKERTLRRCDAHAHRGEAAARRTGRGSKDETSGLPGRRPVEPVDRDLRPSDARLLEAIDRDAFRNGNGAVRAERLAGQPELQEHSLLVLVKGEARLPTLHQFSERACRRLSMCRGTNSRKKWRLEDVSSEDSYDRSGTR